MATKKNKKRATRIRSIDDVWRESPETVQKFLNQMPDYEQLCTEAAYILSKRVTERGIEISDITWRAKTLKSFLEKIQRKKYEDSFTQVTDFAGVRVVCLYLNDIDEVEKIIRSEFEVVEKVDKLNDQEVDRFGYGAIHFIVKLGKASSGARYDDLKNLACEIQVRTVAQDAWAIIEHHLIYKQESDIPKQLIRRLSRLAAIFEDADEQFERVRQERKNYLENVRSQRDQPQEFLENALNLDSFGEYLSWKFKDLAVESFKDQRGQVFEAMDKTKYKKLSDIDRVVDQTQEVREEVVKELFVEGGTLFENSATNNIAIALSVADESFRQNQKVPERWRELIAKHKK